MATYDQARFRATHNSYSGGARGSVVDQLSCGVRLVEFDFHARGFAAIGDFRVGHLKPGMEVDCSGANPSTLMLRDWLAVVARWSDEHVHAPITVVLDSKNDLMGADCGSPEDLNQAVSGVFGDRLFTRDDYDAAGAWPDTSDMLGRIVCVLSGDGNTRASYRWAAGSQPALSINGAGDLVLVYRAASGDIHAFLGQVAAAGTITWQHKSTCSFARTPLSEPAVALSDEGWVVVSHRYEPPPGFQGSRLASVVGRVTPRRRIEWCDDEGRIYGQGTRPRLAIHGTEVREFHTLGGMARETSGVLDTGRRTILWKDDRPGAAPGPPAQDRGDYRGRSYECGVDASGAIVCGAAGAVQPVRFRQLLFVEEQTGDDRSALRDALFFAADAKNKGAIAAALAPARHQVVRAWGFEQADVPSGATIAATDDARARWYLDYTGGAVTA